jgi:hypothetical protein
MDGQIYVKDGEELHALSKSTYEAEETLQKLLADHSNLLAGEQMDDSEPRRWILIDEEFGISDEEHVSHRWSLDHLFLDQAGVPTLVEVKRSGDRRIRRQVVGQMMDYAANAIRYGDPDRIRRLFHQRHEKPDTVLKRSLGRPDPETYWNEVRDNLDRGKVRMVFVADRIPSELRGIVEFLNGQMSPAEVLAVEVTQYEGEGLKTLVPRVIGQTAAAEQTKKRQKTTWDEETFFEEMAKRTSEKLATRVRSFYENAQEDGCDIDWRPGDDHGGFFIDIEDSRFAKFEVCGKIWTDSEYYEDFLEPEEWEELQARAAPLGLEFPEDPSGRKHPQRLLEGTDSEWWNELEDLFEWIQKKVEGGRS